MQTLKIIIIISLSLLVFACDDNSNNSETDIDVLHSLLIGNTLEMLFPDTFDDIDALQMCGVNLPYQNIDGFEDNKTDTYAASLYSDAYGAVVYNQVTCNSVGLPVMPQAFPPRHFYDWAINSGPEQLDVINWSVTDNALSFKTTCAMPNDFGLITVTNNSPLDLSAGTTLSWGNSDSSAIILKFAYYKLDLEKASITNMGYVFTQRLVNSGIFDITASRLSDWGVPSDATHISVGFTKANYVVDKYDNDTKNVLTVSLVETHFMLPTTQLPNRTPN